MAWLITGNGAGLGLLEVVEPKLEHLAIFDYAPHGGVFHIYRTDSDPDALYEKVSAAGGNKIRETVELFASEENDGKQYCLDLWEILSRS